MPRPQPAQPTDLSTWVGTEISQYYLVLLPYLIVTVRPGEVEGRRVCVGAARQYEGAVVVGEQGEVLRVHRQAGGGGGGDGGGHHHAGQQGEHPGLERIQCTGMCTESHFLA